MINPLSFDSLRNAGHIRTSLEDDRLGFRAEFIAN